MESKVRPAAKVNARGETAPVPARKAAVRVLAPRIHWLNEPALVLVAYGVLAYFIRFAPDSLWRSWLAGLLALFGAGLSLTAVIYPRRDALDPVERLALAGLLSLAAGGISGFLLTVSPWGLTLASSLLALAVLNAVCYLAVIYRRRYLAPFEQPRLWPTRGAFRGWLRRQNSAGALIAVVLLIALAAGAGALQEAARAPVADPAMTEFYLLDGDGQVENFPSTAEPGAVLNLNFGVTNRELAAGTYQVLALVSDQLIGDSGAFQLAPGREVRQALALKIPAQAKGQTRIDFILFRDGKRDRDLYLWLTVKPVGK